MMQFPAPENRSNALNQSDGDIKPSCDLTENFNIFSIEGGTPKDRRSYCIHDVLPVPNKNLKSAQTDAGFLCHHSCSEGVSDDEIRVEIACHTIGYARAILSQINQIAYFLVRQAVSGWTSASALSGMVAAKVIEISTTVAYSCAWGAKQMQAWWGRGYSATTMRRVRDELERWGCFSVARVKAGSTYKPTQLIDVDLRRLLQIAAIVFERIAAEPDGFDKFLPSHRCGFLASLWRAFFPGTLYAPSSEVETSGAETEIAKAEADLYRLEQLAEELNWSDYLRREYHSQIKRLQQRIIHMKTAFSYYVELS